MIKLEMVLTVKASFMVMGALAAAMAPRLELQTRLADKIRAPNEASETKFD